MVIEHAVFTVAPGDEAAFEEAFAVGHRSIAASPGYLWGRLIKQIETPGTFLLLVGWETLEHHTVGFRSSELFTAWRAAVGPFFAAPPVVEHYEGDFDLRQGARLTLGRAGLAGCLMGDHLSAVRSETRPATAR
ncbi:MAG TPA: antibiotic biosynthesis monooxygenase [Actinocrinis sp.]|nr:antibiotic biosynthesis monooxygenase [Actinocrinis sp.]